MGRRKSYRANNPASVLDGIDLKDNSLPMSADNLLIGLRDISMAAGTIREPQEGRCYLWDSLVYIEIPASSGDISSVSALDETGAIVSMTATFVTDHYEISGVAGNKYWNIKAWAAGVTPTDAQKKSYTLRGSVEADLFTWLKADEQSGNTVYKAYSGGINGLIINLYAGFHSTQNIYSWQNEIGYSDDTIDKIPRDESITLPPFKDVLGNDLQYQGLCPAKAKFVESHAFQGDGSGYFQTEAGVTPEHQNIESFFYIYMNANITTQIRPFDYNGSTGQTGFDISVGSNGDGNVFFRTTSGLVSTIINLDVGLNKVAVKKYNGVGYIYVNDVLIDSDTTGDLNFNGSGITTIGALYQGSNPIVDNYSMCDIQLWELDNIGNRVNRFNWWPLQEPIQDASTHTAFDVVGGNHATLINGSLANNGTAEKVNGDYGMLGYTISDGVNYYYDQALTQLIPSGVKIPAYANDLSKCVAYTTGGVLADLEIKQNGGGFLDTGTKLEHYPMPRVIQADSDNLLFDTNGDPIAKSVDDFDNIHEIGENIFADTSRSEKVTNIRVHPAPLTRRQLDVEKQITNNA